MSHVLLGCPVSLWGVPCPTGAPHVPLGCPVSHWGAPAAIGVPHVPLGCPVSHWGAPCPFGVSSVPLGCPMCHWGALSPIRAPHTPHIPNVPLRRPSSHLPSLFLSRPSRLPSLRPHIPRNLLLGTFWGRRDPVVPRRNIMNNKVFYQHPNLMRALGMHETVMQVMVSVLGGGETKEIRFPKMVTNCCRFLCYFCRISRQNQRSMFDHLGYLLENSSIGLGAGSHPAPRVPI
ncbi:uncharacterized protein LOC116240212, partial [Phasianus colchicus]|uniref:uncharacterized protein LOC116240212 n=1 Tax=Phasianus colchicus TaxID=9054 RepID=UPI00129DC092